MSSTFASGLSNAETGVEILEGYGATALKVPGLFKKHIDLMTEGHNVHSRGSDIAVRWYLADLSDRAMTTDFFSLHDDAHIHNYGDVLAWCVHILLKSACARQMFNEAAGRGWQIGLDDLSGGAYCIDVEQKLLILDNSALIPGALGRSSYFRNLTLIMMVKALRDIWQEKRHGGFDEDFKPDHIMTLERVRSADCDVVSVLVGWELKQAEHTEVWRHLIGSENGDMAMCFSGHLEREKTTRHTAQALFSAFKQWFRSAERVTMCDHATLDYLDGVLAYAQAQNPFGRKKPSKMNVEIMSCLPDKSAYLHGWGQEILTDPLYCGMDDEINQTHLFHILYDLESVTVQNVPFRSRDLAHKIFPNGIMSEEA